MIQFFEELFQKLNLKTTLPGRVPAVRFVFLIALVACSIEPIERQERGTLSAEDVRHPQDDSFYDAYTFQAKQGFEIELVLESDELDAFLLLNDPAGEQIAQNDDRDIDDSNARITIDAPVEGTYTVFANSREAGETGAYTLTIRTRAPD